MKRQKTILGTLLVMLLLIVAMVYNRFVVSDRLAAAATISELPEVPLQKKPGTPTDIEVYKQVVAPFFKTYCVSCHGPEKSKGGITVHSLHGDLSLGQELDKWESILDMLEFGQMPPAKSPQPKEDEVKAVKTWIKSGMRTFVEKANRELPTAKTRRLTNVEYENTLSELLGFECKVIDELPKDPERRYHFNNNAEMMRIGPEQLDEYLRIARKVMQSAIVGPEKPKTVKVNGAWLSGTMDNGPSRDELNPFTGRAIGSPSRGMKLVGPTHGEFRIRLSASALPMKGRDGVWLNVSLGLPLNGDHNAKPYINAASLYLTNSPDEPKIYEITGRLESVPVALEKQKDGSIQQVRELWFTPAFDDGTLNDKGSDHQRLLATHRALIHWVELEAPYYKTWPPKHHTDILFESPLRESDTKAYVTEVLKRFMTRAYRRPASDKEIERYFRIYQLVRPGVDSFEAAMRETLALVLVSPRFLYHTESDPATDEHYAMASRLSYFLWASMPDSELFELAASKKIDHPKVIEQQVLRMIQDDRSKKFVEDFTLQWLDIKKTLTVPINTELYPRFLHLVRIGETAGSEVPYRTSVRDYMMQETIGFVEHMIRENKSALNVVDSDFAILNERLAKHYGVEGVTGMQMRPVAIRPEHHLGGLLTQSSVLIGNGTGTAPHPIYRAVFLREAILGDTVAPPPSEVPALSDSAGASLEKSLSIAQLLAKHRTVESCNDCHFRLDPWGIPFEDYNAIGRYQPKVPRDGTRVSLFDRNKHTDLAGYQKYLDSINVVKIDARSRVPHGPEVDGLQDLKAYLLKERSNEIVRNVIQRLLTYGLGRNLTFRDRIAVDELLKESKSKGFGMRDMIVSICISEIFREPRPKKED
ncbi:MAG: DUF1592 domain-containing protein [Zavarzinella sp.]